MYVVVTGKVTDPPVPAVTVPSCAPTNTDLIPDIVSVNGSDVTLSMVSVRLATLATADALTVRVNVPLPLLLIDTLPEFPTVTPVGRFATETEYEPLAMPAVVTSKVTVPPVPSIIGPLCIFVTDTPFIVKVNSAEVVSSMVNFRLVYVPGTVVVFPARVKVPDLLLMTTCPDTVTPEGRFTIETGYEPSMMFIVVTVKVAV